MTFNTTLVATDTNATLVDDCTVAVNVTCEDDGDLGGGNDFNCTLSAGYWATHSEYGPAPYDPIWADLPGGAGADTPFFSSGETYYAVVSASLTPQQNSNPYFILAQQHVAVELNILAGADASVLGGDVAAASALFLQYSPATIAAMAPNDPIRQQFLALAAEFEQFNTGAIGPGHCDESMFITLSLEEDAASEAPHSRPRRRRHPHLHVALALLERERDVDGAGADAQASAKRQVIRRGGRSARVLHASHQPLEQKQSQQSQQQQTLAATSAAAPSAGSAAGAGLVFAVLGAVLLV